MSTTFDKSEIARLQQYMRERFGNQKLTLVERKGAKDSVEVEMDGEFIGTIYKDAEDDDISYDFNMAILGIDLPVA